MQLHHQFILAWHTCFDRSMYSFFWMSLNLHTVKTYLFDYVMPLFLQRWLKLCHVYK